LLVHPPCAAPYGGSAHAPGSIPPRRGCETHPICGNLGESASHGASPRPAP
jgi:hypothetical protein